MSENERDSRSRLAEPPDEEIGALIRNAGRRPEVPAEDLATLKEAARSAWQETLASGRRRRLRRRGVLALAASVLLASLGGWLWLRDGAPAPAEQVAQVELMTGPIEALGAEASDSGDVFELGVGDTLSSGITLTTNGLHGDRPARMALRLTGGHSVRLDTGTKVVFHSATSLELEQGAVYVDSGPSTATGPGLEILTPFGTVHEIGTQYEVRLDSEVGVVRVRVREGSVSVRQDGASHDAARGDEIEVRSDGTVARDTVSPAGPEWQWVLAAAPPLDVDGRPLDSFLDWIARETGWQIRYADAALERSASEILVHGTIEGLQPDESIGVVVAGSGLEHRLEEGTLFIDRP